MKATVTIFGSLDDQQEVDISYERTPVGGWFEPKKYEITELTILTPLVIDPSDLWEDLQRGIGNFEGVPEEMICIDCQIEEKQEQEMMFIGCSERVPKDFKSIKL